MQNLFEDGNIQKGFRLKKFEFYNWGAFDGKIWQTNPDGNSSLLTGANGSGKTTLVDAIITLLIPPNQRHYNQSSGAERKRERNELSYVRGAYGSIRDRDQGSAKTEYLRERDCYSILLGTFENKVLEKTITLGQIRWFTQSGMNKIYLTCSKELSISSDILPIDNSRKYKKRLESEHFVRFYDSFQQYSLVFIKTFGFRSEKALNLFSQTVGVKVLGNLNSFIRTHMLEQPDSETAFESLYKNYTELLNAHKQIEKAEKQIEIIEPVIKNGKLYIKCLNDYNIKEGIKNRLPDLFRELKINALERETKVLTDKKDKAEFRYGNKDKDFKKASEELSTVIFELKGNKAAGELAAIESEINHIKERLEEKRTSFKSYSSLAEITGLKTVNSIDDFQANRAEAEKKQNETELSQADLNKKLISCSTELNALDDKISIIGQEIDSLSKRRNNIPHKNIEMRKMICQSINIEEDALPYIGELIQLKKGESLWTNAAERLLHNFALCLIVPDEYYKRVNKYVNNHNLKGRLIYYRVKSDSDSFFDFKWSVEVSEESLPSKLEIKHDTPYKEWVRRNLEQNYNYRCTENINELQNYPRAVTPEGLIKREDRHEKDDRKHIASRANHVLGWDNRAKLKALIEEKADLDSKRKSMESEFGKTEADFNELRKFQQLLSEFLYFKNYSVIDCFSYEKELKSYIDKKKRLLADSEDLKQLESRKAKLEESLQTLTEQKNILQQELGAVKSSLDSVETKLAVLRDEERKSGDIPESEEKADRELSKYIKDTENKTYEQLNTIQISTRDRIDNEIENLLKKSRDLSSLLIKKMQEFINPGIELLNEYPSWTGDTAELEADTENIKTFEDFYSRLKKDDLPKYKKKFRKFLNERMIEDIVGFRESLDSIERSINNSINDLNKSLRNIEYDKSPPSYISLLGEKSKDVTIQAFKTQLKNAPGDSGKIALGDDAELENTFKKMQKLVTSLKEDEYYRKKVLDVRNWLEFAAAEKYTENDEMKRFYKDSYSLSGGEKAKLAYTILASAIAYQFGINDNEEKSFRFVMVDEAFSKVDPENSEYAMQLFKNLSLQLMVVTPLDKINLVERYIEAVHYVENRDNKSYLYNLTFEEYEELKKEHAGKQ